MFEGVGCTIDTWPCDGVVIKDDTELVDMAFFELRPLRAANASLSQGPAEA
jgi:hypothetical protein